MPTTLPNCPDIAAAARRLSWRDTGRFLILLLRVRRLNRRLEADHRRVERDGLDAAGPALLATARRWMEAHEAMNALHGTPELPEVGQVRSLSRRASVHRLRHAPHVALARSAGRRADGQHANGAPIIAAALRVALDG